MKNLLIISARYPSKNDPISGIFVHSKIEELKKYFDRVVVISTTPYTPKFLTRWMQPRRRFDSMAEDYSYNNVEVYFTKNIFLPLNLLKRFRGWQGYRSAKKILKKIEFKPDIIHAHFSWPSGYSAVKLKEKINVPVVITVHEDHDWLINEEKDKKIQYTWTNADALIRVNILDVSILEKYNKNSYPIPSGYLKNKFKPMNQTKCRKKFELPHDKYITFSLGHLVERKGFHDLIDAANLVYKKRKDFLIIIGGNGPMKKKLETMISKYDLNNNVRLIGYVPDEDVPFWMNAADTFVLPSYSEGNPGVMFEALGCGKPFLGTNVGGIPEIIKNDELGKIVRPGNPQQLARALFEFMDKEWDMDYILKYAAQFSWNNLAKRILNIYNQLLNNL